MLFSIRLIEFEMDINMKNVSKAEFNIVAARYQFYRRCQTSSETFYHFLKDVCELAKDCHFDSQEESLIRDRVIFGLRDLHLRDEIIREGGDPPLEHVIKVCHPLGIEVQKGEVDRRRRVINPIQIFLTDHAQEDAAEDLPRESDDFEDIPSHEEDIKLCDIKIENDSNTESSGAPDCFNLSFKSVRRNQFHCTKCGKSFSRNFNFQRHVKLVHAKAKQPNNLLVEFNETENCGQELTRGSNLMRQLEQIHSNNIETSLSNGIKCYQCQICGKKFSRNANMRRHLLKIHVNERSRDDSNVEDQLIKFLCILCDKEFSRKCNLRRHLWSLHASTKKLQCNHCHETFDAVKELKVHMTSYVTESLETPFKCHICNTSFMHNSSLNSHLMSSHHTEGDLVSLCPMCPNVYPSVSTLNQHMAIHSTETFICDICKEGFYLKYHLRKHMLRHARESMNGRPKDDMKFECFVCKRSYEGKKNLSNHMAQHSRDKPFLCSVCGKRFNFVSQLNIHLRTHTGEKPYLCPVCQRRFRRKDDLESHMIIHTGHKPFHCDVCDKRYGRRHKLKLHMMGHRGEKPFSCTICSKRFISQTHLKSHFISHTGEYPHKCNFCPKQYRKMTYLKTHITSNHLISSE